jgi:hypothetical protein
MLQRIVDGGFDELKVAGEKELIFDLDAHGARLSLDPLWRGTLTEPQFFAGDT